jgi:aminoglycoside phosphotransferase (APT) family kinase protein
MPDPLESWLSDGFDHRVEIATMERMSTGHSRAMYRVELSSGQRLVLRVEQGGVFGTGGTEEYQLMAALGQSGFPVAPVVLNEPTGDVIGQPFFVMELVEGDQQDREDRSLGAAAAADLVRTLRRLHDLDSGVVFAAFEASPRPDEATHSQIDRWADVYREAATTPIPLLEEAAAWLHEHAPPLERLHVVHADPGPGNLIQRDGRIIALTDWEFSHLGDPKEDWVYLAMMRGVRTMARGEWIDLFAREGIAELTTFDFRYWGAFNFFKGACANRTALEVFRGHNPAPNLAIIGTALHQTFTRRTADLVAGHQR